MQAEKPAGTVRRNCNLISTRANGVADNAFRLSKNMPNVETLATACYNSTCGNLLEHSNLMSVCLRFMVAEDANINLS